MKAHETGVVSYDVDLSSFHTILKSQGNGTVSLFLKHKQENKNS